MTKRRHPDEVSVEASGTFMMEELETSEAEDASESELGDVASVRSDRAPLDPSDRAVISRAATRANLVSQVASASTSVFERGSQRRKTEGLPILLYFVSELHSSLKSPSSTALPRAQLGNLAGAAAQGLATALQIGPTFSMLAGATAGRDATPPNKHADKLIANSEGLLCFRLVSKAGWHKFTTPGLPGECVAGYLLHLA